MLASNATHNDYNYDLPINSINILTLNIHSLKNKLLDLQSFIDRFSNLNVIVITETWLKETDGNGDFMFGLKNYNAVDMSRSGTKPAGGICVYVREDLEMNVLLKEEFSYCHHVVINLPQHKINIGAIYRAPEANIDEYLRKLDSHLEKYPKSIWIGDININLLPRHEAEIDKCCKYTNTLTSDNFNLLNEISVDAATYSHTALASPSILDHAFTDLVDRESNSYVKKVGISDHNALIVSLFSTIKTPRPHETVKLINYNVLNKKLPQTIKSAQSMDDLVMKIESVIQAATTHKRKHKDSPEWLSNSIRNMMDKRDYFKKV